MLSDISKFDSLVTVATNTSRLLMLSKVAFEGFECSEFAFVLAVSVCVWVGRCE